MRRSAPPTSSANAVSSHFIEGRFNEVKPERAKTQPPALTLEGDRDRLLPGFLAVERSNIASYTGPTISKDRVGNYLGRRRGGSRRRRPHRHCVGLRSGADF